MNRLVGNWIGDPAPDPGADIGNVVAARSVQQDVEGDRVGISRGTIAWRNAPDIDRSALGLKGTTKMRQPATVAQIGVAAGIQAQMVKALVHCQLAEILDDPNWASRDIGAQLL